MTHLRLSVHAGLRQRHRLFVRGYFAYTVVRGLKMFALLLRHSAPPVFGTRLETAYWRFATKRLRLILEMHWQRVRPHSLSCLNSQRYTSVWIQPMWAHASACLCLCTVSIILQNQAECVRVYVQYSDIMQTSHSALFFIILLASRPLIWCRFTIIQSNHGRTFNLGFTALASFSYSSWTAIESCYCPCACVCVCVCTRKKEMKAK